MEVLVEFHARVLGEICAHGFLCWLQNISPSQILWQYVHLQHFPSSMQKEPGCRDSEYPSLVVRQVRNQPQLVRFLGLYLH
jgi:hypothetical protein